MTRNPGPPTVEVAFARPGCQRVVVVALAAGPTAGEAVQASGLLAEFPELRESSLALGVWGRRVDARHRLRAGDRVEIYRPLRIDPRAARREAARTDRSGNRRARDRAG